MGLTESIQRALLLVAKRQSVSLPHVIERELVLLESGLDSLGFAILVAELESELGYDPFSLMETPFYPSTYGELCDMYETYSSYRIVK